MTLPLPAALPIPDRQYHVRRAAEQGLPQVRSSQNDRVQAIDAPGPRADHDTCSPRRPPPPAGDDEGAASGDASETLPDFYDQLGASLSSGESVEAHVTIIGGEYHWFTFC